MFYRKFSNGLILRCFNFQVGMFWLTRFFISTPNCLLRQIKLNAKLSWRLNWRIHQLSCMPNCLVRQIDFYTKLSCSPSCLTQQLTSQNYHTLNFKHQIDIDPIYKIISNLWRRSDYLTFELFVLFLIFIIPRFLCISILNLLSYSSSNLNFYNDRK